MNDILSAVRTVDLLLPPSEQAVLAVLPVAEMEPSVVADPAQAGHFFTPGEIAERQAYRIRGRQLEHAAGRLAAKVAAARHLSAQGYHVPVSALVIQRTPDGADAGRPVLKLPEEMPSCALSISHSSGMAVALVTGGGRAGLDLEFIQPRTAAFAESAFTGGELAWLTGQQVRLGRSYAEMLTLGWCIKEALLKCVGSGLRSPLRAIACRGWRESGRPDAIPLICEGGYAWMRYVELEADGLDWGPARGLLSVGPTYALAALHF